MSATLVVPCFNEASRLDTKAFLAHAENTDVGFVFVDDGSRDGTYDVLRRMADQRPASMSALHLERNAGKAEAVRSGMRVAAERGSTFVGFWDADLATPLGELDALLSCFAGRDQLQMVMGARVLLLGRRITRRAVRHYAGRLFATAVSMALRLPVYDTQCGAKVFRNDDLTRQLFAEPFLSRWIFDVELIARLQQAVGARSPEQMATYLIEQPLTTWTDVPDGKVKMRDFVRSAVDLGKIYRHYLR